MGYSERDVDRISVKSGSGRFEEHGIDDIDWLQSAIAKMYGADEVWLHVPYGDTPAGTWLPAYVASEDAVPFAVAAFAIAGASLLMTTYPPDARAWHKLMGRIAESDMRGAREASGLLYPDDSVMGERLETLVGGIEWDGRPEPTCVLYQVSSRRPQLVERHKLERILQGSMIERAGLS